MKIFTKVTLIIVFVSTIAYSETATFTLKAEVERNTSINLEKDFIYSYIKNLEIYPKFFPNIVSVTKLTDTESEWLYKVEAPLAAPYNLTFTLEDKSPSSDTLLFESKDKLKDYLYCQAILSPAAENKTKITFVFKISMTREKASDVHVLAGILGEKFLSEQMKSKLEGDLETFISKASKDMYLASRTSGK
jgi:ribosome-associated toxin RatA of RatAB toxin-antitoxin module